MNAWVSHEAGRHAGCFTPPARTARCRTKPMNGQVSHEAGLPPRRHARGRHHRTRAPHATTWSAAARRALWRPGLHAHLSGSPPLWWEPRLDHLPLPPPGDSRSTHGAVKRPPPPRPPPAGPDQTELHVHPGPAPQRTRPSPHHPRKHPEKHLWTNAGPEHAISVPKTPPQPRPHRSTPGGKCTRERRTDRHGSAERSLGLYGIRKNYIGPISP